MSTGFDIEEFLTTKPRMLAKANVDRFATEMRMGMDHYGRGALAQFWDIFRLSALRKNISLEEYFIYGLYRSNVSFPQKSKYLGLKKNRRLMKRLNENPQTADTLKMFHKKWDFDRYLVEENVKCPPLQAVFCNDGSCGDAALSTKEQLIEFLRKDAVYPIFVKPSDSSLGLGSISILGIDKTNNELIYGNEERSSLEAFVKTIVTHYSSGYLFQSHLKQAKELVKFFGRAPSVFRVTTTKQPGKSAATRYIVLRLAKPESMGVVETTTGLYQSEVDPSTGKLMCGFWDIGTYFSQGLRDLSDTGAHWTDITISGVQQMCDMAEQVHEKCDGVYCIGFDIVLTDDGPVMLEANSYPYHRTVQRLRDVGVKPTRKHDIIGIERV